MFKLLQRLWCDEAGYLLSAEAVTVGTLGVVGATVGIGAVSKSVNDELTETAYAIRGLDQSFTIPEQRGAGAWTAGSTFHQPSVEESQADLGRYLEDHDGRPLVLSSRTSQPSLFSDEHARLTRDQSTVLSPEDREEFRRIRQRSRRQDQISSEPPDAPVSAVAE